MRYIHNQKEYFTQSHPGETREEDGFTGQAEPQRDKKDFFVFCDRKPGNEALKS